MKDLVFLLKVRHVPSISEDCRSFKQPQIYFLGKVEIKFAKMTSVKVNKVMKFTNDIPGLFTLELKSVALTSSEKTCLLNCRETN